MSAQYEELIGNAILGIDTIWGGDVMCASGTGRFIADSWFSERAAAARLHRGRSRRASARAAASPANRPTWPPSMRTWRRWTFPPPSPA